MLNRTIAPDHRAVEHIHLLKPEHIKLDNGLDLYFINAGDAELVRVEFIFPNVLWNADAPLANSATAGMLLNGTSQKNAAQIAEAVDFYGAFLNAENGPEHSVVTLYSLTKHLRNTLPVVKEVLSDAIFPESELAVYKQNIRQKFQVSQEKNDFLARKAFNELVFGPQSSLGFPVGLDDFDKIDRQSLLETYVSQYQAGNCTVIVSGKVNDLILNEINRLFGRDWNKVEVGTYVPDIVSANPGPKFIDKPKSIQSAIRIGKPIINRLSPDFSGLQVLNTVLGGYFGSRLMANIREDKGYTYGIGSAIYSIKNASVFFMATEVGVDVCDAALSEIYKEVEKLCTDLIPESELQLVKNYMIGTFLGSLENAFSHADKFKKLHAFGLDYSYYDRYLDTVRNCTSQQLREIAQKHLSGGFYEVVVGKR